MSFDSYSQDMHVRTCLNKASRQKKEECRRSATHARSSVIKKTLSNSIQNLNSFDKLQPGIVHMQLARYKVLLTFNNRDSSSSLRGYLLQKTILFLFSPLFLFICFQMNLAA